MILRVGDLEAAREALMDIGGTHLARFLRRSGWQEVTISADRSFVVFAAPDHPFHQVKVPLKKDYSDYLLALQLAVERTGDALEIPPIELLERLRLERYDVLYASAQVESSETVLADRALDLLNGTWKLLTAAAWAEDVGMPRALYRGPRPDRLIEFLAGLRFAHTEPGSFRFPVLSPVPDQDMQPDEGQLDLVVESFERRALRRAVAAVHAAVIAAIEFRDTSQFTFQQRIPDGVSANLCRALADLPADFPVRFEAKWSPVAPERPNAAVVPAGLREVFEEAADRLGPDEVRGRITVVGYVRGLRREPDEEGGEVTVRSTLPDSPGLFRIDLAGEEYEDAIAAHESRRAVLVDGDLERTGTGTRRLGNVAFRVLGYDFDELEDVWEAEERNEG